MTTTLPSPQTAADRAQAELLSWRAEEGRLRAALEMLAQVRSVSGSAQAHMRTQLRIIDAVLAGADVRELATVEAVAAGTWRPVASGQPGAPS
jgi:hypothetical protein